MITNLKLFDLDGTLFRSPNVPRDAWEDSMGPPWVPEVPGPEWWIQDTLQAAKEAIRDPETYAVLMTGRNDDTFSRRVHQLLQQEGLAFNEIHLTPEGMDTADFKAMALGNMLDKLRGLEQVTIWDDDAPKMDVYRHLVELDGLPCVTHHITEDRPSFDSSLISPPFLNKTLNHAGGAMGDHELKRTVVRLVMGKEAAPPPVRVKTWSLGDQIEEGFRQEKEKKRQDEAAKTQEAFGILMRNTEKEHKKKLGDLVDQVFDHLQKTPAPNVRALGKYLVRAYFPNAFQPSETHIEGVLAAFRESNGDLATFGKCLQRRGLIDSKWRRLLRRWLMASEDRWAMLSNEERGLAGYALRSVQERQGWQNAVNRLRNGGWSWPTFENRALGILRGYEGKLDTQFMSYIINKVKDMYEQGDWDNLHHFKARSIL